MTTDYHAFLATKTRTVPDAGISIDTDDLHPSLFAFQRDLVAWAAKKGRAAIWADTGLGKTRMQLEWARVLGQPVLIIAPLAVTAQTIEEAHRLGTPVTYARNHTEITETITITNYERADAFDPSRFTGVVLDESSILKNFEGKTRGSLIRQWANTPARLCCTATPAPNDIGELANHSEFLGIMPRNEMLAAFFVHDEIGWRPKGHAYQAMYQWMSEWASAVRRPSDMGHPEEDPMYELPPLTYHQHIVGVNEAPEGQLFATDLGGIGGRSKVRRSTMTARCEQTAELVNDSVDPWVVWCGLNDEADTLTRLIPGAVNVQGNDTPENKAHRLTEFTHGEYRVLITKPSIAGMGLNFQHAAHMAFTGLTDSYEAYYQAVRRCWRFGQKRPVHVHIIVSELEQQIVANVQAKEREAQKMTAELVTAMHDNTAPRKPRRMLASTRSR